LEEERNPSGNLPAIPGASRKISIHEVGKWSAEEIPIRKGV